MQISQHISVLIIPFNYIFLYFKLGIKITLSLEKEPLGTGNFIHNYSIKRYNSGNITKHNMLFHFM